MKPGRTLTLLILGALSTISPLSIDMYLPALTQIAEDLHTTAATASLSLSSYFIGLAVGQIFYGPLLDRFGRKKPLYVGLAIYVIASIGCTQSTSINMLIAFRALQALGGCSAQVACMALVLDFFPIKESAKVFSALVLVISVSPLLAPTIGSVIAQHWGWHWIFISLALISLLILWITATVLPPGRDPDPSVILGLRPIFRSFREILFEPQFYTYAFAGAFSFAGLLAYVAGSPILFMEVYEVSASTYSHIFALLSLGFIGTSQLNSLILKRWSNEQIFKAALTTQVAAGLLFWVGDIFHWWGLPSTIALLFVSLSCLGISYPNAAALALAPFTRNTGSASALLGTLQIGIASLASSAIAIFNTHDTGPIVAILAATSCIGMAILVAGKRHIRHPLLHNAAPIAPLIE